jgi:methionyl-tRNA formyltransferase
MRIIFMGTPDFSVPTLERILADGYEVAAVFTQLDRPKGRHFALTPPPVKVCAQRHGIPVYQPQTLKDENAIAMIKDLAPDCIVVVAYGRILPQAVLDIPRFGCVNVHASLLPRYRGAAPIHWAVINGDDKTGVTTMFMAKGIDTGDMILKAETPIGENETTGELHDRLTGMGADTLSKTLALLFAGKAPREKQDDAKSSYVSVIDKATGAIDWGKSAQEIHNLVRGLAPYPAAHTTLCGALFKICTTRLKAQGYAQLGCAQQDCGNAQPGSVIAADDSGIFVACGDKNALLLTEVQAQGGKRMSAAAYANGHGVKAGTIFGQ